MDNYSYLDEKAGLSELVASQEVLPKEKIIEKLEAIAKEHLDYKFKTVLLSLFFMALAVIPILFFLFFPLEEIKEEILVLAPFNLLVLSFGAWGLQKRKREIDRNEMTAFQMAVLIRNSDYPKKERFEHFASMLPGDQAIMSYYENVKRTRRLEFFDLLATEIYAFKKFDLDLYLEQTGKA